MRAQNGGVPARVRAEVVEGAGAGAREDAGHDAVASLARETEDLDRGRVHVAGERLAQERAGAEEAGAHGRRGYGETGRGFLDGHVLDFAHHEHRAKRHRQLIDTAFEDAPHFGPHRRVGGRFGLVVGHVGLRQIRGPAHAGRRTARRPGRASAGAAASAPG